MTDITPPLQHFVSTLMQDYAQEHIQPAVDFLQPLVHQQVLAEKEHLIEAGNIADEMYFIVQGIFRVYYLDHNGNEINQQFYLDGESISHVLSVKGEVPCSFYLQALTESTVLVANSQVLYQQGKNNVAWLNVENAIFRELFIKTARREAKMLLGNAEQRYRWFLKESPELAEKLPLYQIASYLGVTPVSLSRLRKKLNQSSTSDD